MARKSLAFATLALCLALGLARAQDYGSPDPDPPERAARLSYLEGDVSLQPAGEEASAPALLNRPLTTGDQLWTEENARAEIQVGAMAVRLAGNTGFSLDEVSDDTIRLHLTEGVIQVSVRALNDNDFIAITTPNVTLSLLHPGSFRVEVNPRHQTTVVEVRDGEVRASGSSQDVLVGAQQAVTFSGVGQFTARFHALGEPDEFDSWAAERERRDYLASTRSQYVSPEVTGYEDLEEYGTWSSEPEYGQVWTPSYVQSGWSPYSYGRWVSVAPWGWTWIDDAPWGYAPFHYGRWAHVRNRWCWVPGPRHVRAVYAPALVGWMGIGQPRASVSWFPLGPRDVYMPDGRYSRRYVERVNVTNTLLIRTAVNEIYENRARNVSYRNRAVPGAVTTVSRAAFASAQPVRDHRVRIDDRVIARTTATAMAPSIAPGLESRLGGAPVHRPTQAELVRQAIATRHRQTPITRPAYPSEPDQSALAERPTRVPPVQRPAQSEQPREDVVRRIREQQERREAESRQPLQHEVRERQRAPQPQPVREQVRQQVQRQPESAARQEAARQSQQRERPVERARVEHSESHRPADSKPANSRDDRPRPDRQ